MLIIADRCGGLANRLWTLANVLAWGVEHERAVATLGFEDSASGFPGLTTRLGVSGVEAGGERIARLTRPVPRGAWDLAFRVNLRLGAVPHVALADHEAIDLDSTAVTGRLRGARLTFLTGLYHLARASLELHQDEIRRLLGPSAAARASAEDLLARVRGAAEIAIGVHVRHGDYRTFCDGLMFYDTEEYAGLMRHLAALWPGKRVAFVVCSDEPQPPAAFAGLAVHPGPGDRYGDLYSLALCDYIVGPSSTFSRWASFWGRVPLWMMDWRSAERQGQRVEKNPDASDFAVCTSATHLVDRGSLAMRTLS